MSWFKEWRARAAKRREKLAAAKAEAKEQVAVKLHALLKVSYDQLIEAGFRPTLSNVHRDHQSAGQYLLGPDKQTIFLLTVYLQGAAHLKRV